MNTRAFLVVAGALGVAGVASLARAKQKPADPFAQPLPTCASDAAAAASSVLVGAGLPPTCLAPCGGPFADAAELQHRHDGAAPTCGVSPDWHDNTAWDNAVHDADAFGQAAWDAGTAGGLDNLRKAKDALKKLVTDNLGVLLIAGAVVVGGVVLVSRVVPHA